MDIKTKDQVLTLIHDINSPLVALKGLLNNNRNFELETAAVEKIYSICKKLTSFYPETLSESGSLVDTIEGVLDLKEIEIPKVVFSTEIDPSIRDLVFQFSKMELERSLSNIINNANEAGATQVCIKVSKTKKNIMIKVIDNGTGFYAHEIASVQTKQKSSNKPGGSGIGLSSCQSFLSNIGGELKILSTPYIGSNIIMSFPRHLFDHVDFGPKVS